MTYIYKITNNVNNKSYIGLTKRNPKERWWEHCKPSRSKVSALTCAINKYGKENFTFKIIYETNNPNLMERYFIKLNNTISPNGYNLTFGGENPIFTEEECKRRSERRKLQPAPVPKGTKQSDEWIKKRTTHLVSNRPIIKDEVEFFISVNSIKKLGFGNKEVINCCKGLLKQTKGSSFRYATVVEIKQNLKDEPIKLSKILKNKHFRNIVGVDNG